MDDGLSVASFHSKMEFAREHARALPPVGWVAFCESHPDECNVEYGTAQRVNLDKARWSELVNINRFVNSEIEPFTDQELHNVPELWSYPEDKGDCEDYVLLKRHYLMQLGWPREALLITVVLDEEKAGHAVLTVVTDRGDFVLDNQAPNVESWLKSPYTFIKRQSQIHPNEWVLLDPSQSNRLKYVSGN